MTEEKFLTVPLEKIERNPFQPRIQEDPDHVERIARSIEKHGLLQSPVGRLVDGRVQLSAGNTRLSAFELLNAQNHNSDYASLPVRIRRLSDIEMFEMAIAENHDRKDLSPIEIARAMATYRDKFGKNSSEIGDLFQLSGSAVRNYLRMLELPEQVQDQITAGQISQGTARKLLTVQKIAPEAVKGIASEIVDDGIQTVNEVARVIENTLDFEAYKMHGRYREGEPKGGYGLWPLKGWTPDPNFLPNLTPAQYAKAFPQFEKYKDQVRNWEYSLNTNPKIEPRQMTQFAPIEAVEAGVHLLRPPACTSCPFYVVNEAKHYCGIKLCWNRKRIAWSAQELNRLQLELGIPAYDPKEDGKYYLELTWWRNDEIKLFEKWVAEKADHLRLRISYDSYREHRITNSPVVQLISVKQEFQEEIAEKKQAEDTRDYEYQHEREKREAAWRRRDLSHAFLQEVAVHYFSPGFESLNGGVLADLAHACAPHRREEVQDPKERRQKQLAVIAGNVLREHFTWNELERGPVFVAKDLQGLARTWGIDLPADWLDQAKAFAGEEDSPEAGVSIETEEETPA